MARSWRVIVCALRALRRDPELAALPVIAAVFNVCVVLFGLSLWSLLRPDGAGSAGWWGWLYATPFAVTAVAGTILCEGALVAGACHRMRGGNPTVRSALAEAATRLPHLLLWGLVNTGWGLLTIIALSGRRLGPLARLAVMILNTAWRTTTYLVVPAIVIDRDTAPAAIKRSAKMLRDTWGPNLAVNLGGNAAIGSAVFAALFAGNAIASSSDNPAVDVAAIAASVAALAVLALLANIVRPYLKTALYLHATDRHSLDGFDTDIITDAFTPRSAPARRRAWWRSRRTENVDA